MSERIQTTGQFCEMETKEESLMAKQTAKKRQKKIDKAKESERGIEIKTTSMSEAIGGSSVSSDSAPLKVKNGEISTRVGRKPRSVKNVPQLPLEKQLEKVLLVVMRMQHLCESAATHLVDKGVSKWQMHLSICLRKIYKETFPINWSACKSDFPDLEKIFSALEMILSNRKGPLFNEGKQTLCLLSLSLSQPFPFTLPCLKYIMAACV